MINTLVDESERVMPSQNASFNDSTVAFILACTLKRPVVFVKEDTSIVAILPISADFGAPFYFKENDSTYCLLAPKNDVAFPSIDRSVAFFKPGNKVTFESSVTQSFTRLNISLSDSFVIAYKPNVLHV
jgi:hypothetical protein